MSNDFKYPIVSVKTSDDIVLHGFFYETDNKDEILIHIHGTAGNFYENMFVGEVTTHLANNNIASLAFNNRGSAVLQEVPPIGAATEKFEDCLLDINAWMEFVLNLGYKQIILQGHSLGTEKAVYYLNKGKYKEKASKVILLGFSDTYGDHYDRSPCPEKLMAEAKKLVKQNKGHQFLTSHWLARADILPFSAASYIDFFSEDSVVSKVLPFRNGKELPMLRNIEVPILGVIGDQEEYLVISILKAMQLIEKENKLAKCYQIKNASHSFYQKEKELAEIIFDFIIE